MILRPYSFAERADVDPLFRADRPWESLDPLLDQSDVSYARSGHANAEVEHLITAIQINQVEDNVYILLNPRVRSVEGEWEVCVWASWYAGGYRYPSFQAFMQNAYMCEDYDDTDEEE